jgi:hypothetical protein
MADAGTQGAIGPNLDNAFQSDKQQGFAEQDMADIVRGQIAYPEPPMPKNLVTGREADSVALYVAKCSANPSCGVTAAGRQQAAGGSPGSTTNATGPAQGAPKPDGKQVFASAGCAGCHTLKAAGSNGNVGPNLDELKPSKGVVAHQVEVGGGAMPAFKGQLSQAEIDAVAAFVAANAGR